MRPFRRGQDDALPYLGGISKTYAGHGVNRRNRNIALCRALAAVQLLWQQPELAFDPRARISTSLLDAGPVPDESLERLLDRFDAKAAWLKRYPHELSGGELMRLSMVRALLVEPAYLIADEATGNA